MRSGGLWRSRWAAFGAAVAVSVGAGGVVHFVSASSGAPSDFVAITPLRVLDTRDPVNVGLNGPFVSAVSQDLTVTGEIATTTGTQVVVPVAATGVVLNVTVVAPTSDGFISVRPADAPGAPATSSLNFLAGSIIPNSVTVQVPTTGVDAGKIELTYDAYGTAGPTADVLVDVVGYYQAAPAPGGGEVTTTTTTTTTAAPKTGFVSVPATSFFPGGAGDYGGYSPLFVGRYLTGVNGDGANRLLATVSLPDGATITSVEFHFWDASPLALELALVRYVKGSQVSEVIASVQPTGNIGAIRNVSPAVHTGSEVVDNDAYTYVAAAFASNWPANALQIVSLRVGYTEAA